MHCTKRLFAWLTVPLGLLLLVTGCNGQKPILGGGGSATLAPTVTLVSPTDNASTVSITTTITAGFSEPVAPLTGGASFTVTGAVVGTNPTGTVTLDPSGLVTTFTLTPTTTLAPFTYFTATITGARSLATGLPMASPFVWHFTSGSPLDIIRPRVTVTTPVTTSPGPSPLAPANASITATFTEPLAPATVTASSFTVTTPDPGTSPVGLVTYSTASRTAIFTPDAPLTVGTVYTATILASVTDLAGNQLAGNQALLPAFSTYIWSFTATAADVSAPTIILTSPTQLATEVATNAAINATFSKAMDPLTFTTATFTAQTMGMPTGPILAGTVSYDPLSRIATLLPSSELAPSTTYAATVMGAQDLAGNLLAAGIAPNPWTFTTGTAHLPMSIALGAAAVNGIMATSAITNTGAATMINGNVCLEPGTSNGLLPVQVNGQVHINDTVSHQAAIDLLVAYTFAKNLPPGTTVTAGADLAAVYPLGIPPGTYTSGSTILVSTPLIMDAGGNANAVWVFQIGSSLTTTANISLVNGAQAKNIYWVPTLDATIGVGSTFYGTVVTGRDATAKTGAVINGRILAGATLAGTIALDTNTVNVPAP
ncbi:MAG: Ig-like domain-containing protein [Geothrix sp.]|uniref:Ig-like domain-containing protein n=1 Tax=Geothrix sp. TaxID=1962974 RepID=UPI003BB18D2A